MIPSRTTSYHVLKPASPSGLATFCRYEQTFTAQFCISASVALVERKIMRKIYSKEKKAFFIEILSLQNIISHYLKSLI